MTESACSTSQSWARKTIRSTIRRWPPSATIFSSIAPAPGAISWASARRVMASPTTACTSESRSTVSAPRSAVDSSSVTRSAFFGSASQPPSRLPMPTERSRRRTTSAERKFSPTKSPRLCPSWSFLVGMIAVCGIGSPIGRLNSAVTANQSASAPTIPASAAAATNPVQPPAPADPAHFASA